MHALDTPPAFILSQDQTLKTNILRILSAFKKASQDKKFLHYFCLLNLRKLRKTSPNRCLLASKLHQKNFKKNKCNSLNYIILATVYSSRAQAQVPSTLKGLTSVFGMGTGVPPPPSHQDYII